jgi:predicted transposase YdaD
MTTVFPRDDFIDGLLDQGRAEGEAKGEAKGRAEGEAKMLLRVLAARGLAVPSDVRERILSCTDTTRLEAWADQAVSATSITEIFGD